MGLWGSAEPKVSIPLLSLLRSLTWIHKQLDLYLHGQLESSIDGPYYGEKNIFQFFIIPFPSLGAVGRETPMPKAASACEAVCYPGMSVYTPHLGTPCLVWSSFGSSSVGFAQGCWVDDFLVCPSLLGGQISLSTVSPSALVCDSKATTFAMPPSKGIRAQDFSMVTLLWALRECIAQRQAWVFPLFCTWVCI